MELKKYLDEWFEDETREVGLYLAMARKAEQEGYPEVARQFTENAWEEAEHAAINAELAERIGSTRENLEKMLEGEKEAAKTRLVEAEHHDSPEKHYLYVTAKDEERHANALEGLLEKLK